MGGSFTMTFLRICDRYPLRVEYKGGMTQFVSKTLIITSNREPRDWYKCECDVSALYRRINQYLILTPDGYAPAPILCCRSHKLLESWLRLE